MHKHSWVQIRKAAKLAFWGNAGDLWPTPPKSQGETIKFKTLTATALNTGLPKARARLTVSPSEAIQSGTKWIKRHEALNSQFKVYPYISAPPSRRSFYIKSIFSEAPFFAQTMRTESA